MSENQPNDDREPGDELNDAVNDAVAAEEVAAEIVADAVIDELAAEVIAEAIVEEAIIEEAEAFAVADEIVEEAVVREAVAEAVATEIVVDAMINEAIIDEVAAEALAEGADPELVAEVVAEAAAEELIAEQIAEEIVAEAVAEEVAAIELAEEIVEEAIIEEAVAEAVAEELVAEAIVEEFIAEEVATEIAIEAEEELAEAEVVAEAEALTEEAAELDPVEEFREAVRNAPGDWYVIHSYAGYENKVKANIESRSKSLDMEDYIFQVEVPIEEVVEIKQGQRKTVKRNKFPGYVLVRMDLTDKTVDAWGTVRHTPGVTGFVGQAHDPIPLTLDEVVRILAPEPEKPVAPVSSGSKGGFEPEAATQTEIDVSIGDSVTGIDGPFATSHATISEIHVDAQEITGLVEIFGRETPVELGFNQIQKN